MIKVNNITVQPEKFPDGTLLFNKNNIDLLNEDTANILWKFENNEELVTIIFLTRYLHSNGISHIRLNMPYIPNARQDRVKSKNDVFTLKYFADVINWLEFDCVKV